MTAPREDARATRPTFGRQLGLQPERTILAWMRTSLVCVVLFLTTAALADSTGARIVAALGGGSVGVVAVTAAAVRTVALQRHPRGMVPRWCPASLAAAIAGADLLALVLLLS